MNDTFVPVTVTVAFVPIHAPSIHCESETVPLGAALRVRFAENAVTVAVPLLVMLKYTRGFCESVMRRRSCALVGVVADAAIATAPTAVAVTLPEATLPTLGIVV